MYARKVEDQELTFIVSGLLWRRSLIMLDEQTRSHWSHILGEAKQGPLKGKALEQIPSVMTDWASWKKLHPETTVAKFTRTSANYITGFYQRPDQFVLGLVHEGRSMAWNLGALEHTIALMDRIGKESIVVLLSPEHWTPRAYFAKVGEQSLTFFVKDGQIRDKETGTRWSPINGKGLEGALSGKRLVPLPAIVSYARVWSHFHPKSKEWPGQRKAMEPLEGEGPEKLKPEKEESREEEQARDSKCSSTEKEPEHLARLLSFELD